ncbi:hypothetical protein V9T40_010739 [Parthenolecanium corni]|uniref:diacylglycerol O-acyltransferase n=1 Tax=Parthenolecanium corni TaxID=536013 RepID=A0AAN9T460_9HEMI
MKIQSVAPIGCVANLCTNTNNVAELFPDIDIRTVTLSSVFRFPLTREILMAFGLCTANKKNILYLLNSSPSKAVMIFPGGNKEYHLSHPGNVYTIVKNRKGFIRLALESGSSLVPVFSFGEQNIFDTLEFKSPVLIGLNKLFYKCTRGSLTYVWGRGCFQDNYGILPHRRPITTVVGKPIEVPKVENPPAELVDEYHEKFFKALIDLFEEYKYNYDEAGDEAQLVMV